MAENNLEILLKEEGVPCLIVHLSRMLRNAGGRAKHDGPAAVSPLMILDGVTLIRESARTIVTEKVSVSGYLLQVDFQEGGAVTDGSDGT